MADFEIANRIVGGHEGGYSNRASDRGGETYAGISRKYWPNWNGWSHLDQIKRKRALKNNDRIPELDPLVPTFYKANFWDKHRLAEINNQSIANIIYDWSVNSGTDAIKAIQRIVGTKPDGVVGDITLKAINTADQEGLFNKYKNVRIKFYKTLTANDPTQARNLNGWLNRVNSFIYAA